MKLWLLLNQATQSLLPEFFNSEVTMEIFNQEKECKGG